MQIANAGLYTVVVSNTAGSVASTGGVLNVLTNHSIYSLGLKFGANESNSTLAGSSIAGVPGAAQAHWNNLNGQTGTASGMAADIAGIGTATAVTLQWTSPNTWTSDTRGGGNGANFRVGTPDAALMNGYLDTDNATTTTVTIWNITPELILSGYDVFIYTLGGGAGRGGAYRIVDASSGKVLGDYLLAQMPYNPTVYTQVPTNSPAGQYGTGDYLVFRGLSAANITIEATTAHGLGFGNPPRAPVNAVQLVARATTFSLPMVAPAIAVPPQNQVAGLGASAAFSVVATGASLAFQWQFNGADLYGATGALLAINNARTADAGSYRVIVSNAAGSVISPSAILVVNNELAAPIITAQPQALTVTVGQSATFSVMAARTAVSSYQWQLNGANLSGAIYPSLTLNNVQFTHAGNYSVIVANAAASVASTSALLTVNPFVAKPVITTQPQDVLVNAGLSTNFRVDATGATPLSYQWQFNGTSLIGATNASLSLKSLTTSQAGYYAVTVSNIAGTVVSTAAILTVQMADTNQDGLPDAWVNTNFGNTTAAVAATDSDGDGYTNFQEYLAGTDPLDPASALRITDLHPSGSDVLLSFSAAAGQVYRVESRESLADTNSAWTLRYSFTYGADGVVQTLDVSALGAVSSRFYRVRCGPPDGEVSTDPVGWYKVPLTPGANTISVPLHPLAAARGLMANVTGNTVALNGNPNLTANWFVPANSFSQYILLVRKDASNSPGVEGDWWPITSKTVNTVTLNPGADVLPGLLVSGDAVEIRRLISLKDLFGYGPTLALNQDHDFSAATGDYAKADVIRFLSGTSFGSPIFYHDGSLAPEGYYLGGIGPLDGSTITVLPGQAFMVFRPLNSGATDILVTGQAQSGRLTQYLQPGPNAVGTPFAGLAPVGTSNLRESGWALDHDYSAATGNYAKADLIRLITGTSFGPALFYHDGTLVPAGWYVNGALNNNSPLQPGKAYLFFISGSNPKPWRQVVPYAQ